MEDGTPIEANAAVRFALDLALDDIPPDVMRLAAFLMLDTLGVGAAASGMEAGRIARETAVRLYGAGDPAHAATLPFDGRRVSTAGAGFAFGSQIDNLDAHDGYNPVKGHIGCAVVPALCALAEAQDLTGPEALLAMVIGYEVAGRAGLALHSTVSDYHTSGAWNALGVATMGGRMRGLDAHQTRQALGIAEYHGPRSQMMREIATPTMLHDGSGMGAFVGISAVTMAELGFDGAPAISVEAPEVAEFWSDLGTRWLTRDQYVKPYPICRWAHAAIDGAGRLCRNHGITPDQVAGIRIGTFKNAVALFPGMPTTTSEAQYSLPFSVAMVIAHGRVGVNEISGAALADPLAARLVGLTELAVEDRHEARFPSGRWADVTITLTDGRTRASGDINAHGGPDDPFTEIEFLEKFRAFAAPALGNDRAGRIEAEVLALTEPGASFCDVLALLSDPPA